MGRLLQNFHHKTRSGKWENDYHFQERVTGPDDDGNAIVKMGVFHIPVVKMFNRRCFGDAVWSPIGLDPLSKIKPTYRKRLPKHG